MFRKKSTQNIFFFSKSFPFYRKLSERNRWLIGRMGLILKMKTIIILVFILIISQTSLFFAIDRAPSLVLSRQDLLEDVLHKAGDYCDRLKRIALHFVCFEEIRENIHHPFSLKDSPNWIKSWSTEQNNYVYDYQLIRKGVEIGESRILLKENGKSVEVKRAPLKTKRFYFRYVILGPVGLLAMMSRIILIIHLKRKKTMGKIYAHYKGCSQEASNHRSSVWKSLAR